MPPSRQSNPAPLQDAFELGKILSIVLEKRWLLIGSILLCVGVGAVYLKLATPIYEAKATIEILVSNRNPAGMEIPGVNLGSAEALATVEANFQRISLFRRVMEREDISSLAELGGPENPVPIASALRLEEWTKVDLRRGSRLIDIRVRHPKPEIAMALANGLVEEYTRERAMIETGSSKSDFEMLLGEQKDIDRRLKTFEASEQSIAKVLAARAEIQTVETEVRVLLQSKGELHPDVKTAKLGLEGMFAKLETLVGRARQLLKEAEIDGLASDPGSSGGTLSREDRLHLDADRLELAQRSLLRDIESEHVVREVIVGSLKEAEISKDIQSSSIALVEPAFAPLQPVSPKAVQVLSLAIMLGGSLGLASIWGLIALNGTVSTIEEAENATGLPVIGEIPFDKRLPTQAWLKKQKSRHLTLLKQKFSLADTAGSASRAKRTRRLKGGKIEPLVLLSDPGSQVAESFRTLRATLGLRVGNQGLKSCLVVSALPNEGKSFVAANLAVSLAVQATTRTLLIEADLRCPATQVIFDVESSSAGLSEALRDHTLDPQSLVLPSGIENLDILTAGSATRNPAEILSSPALAEVLENLENVYDRIIIDAAPVNVVADGILLAPLVSSVLLVARAGQTHRRAVNHATQLLTDVNCPPTGLVLNRIEKRSGDTPDSSQYSRRAQKYGESYD